MDEIDFLVMIIVLPGFKDSKLVLIDKIYDKRDRDRQGEEERQKDKAYIAMKKVPYDVIQNWKKLRKKVI